MKKYSLLFFIILVVASVQIGCSQTYATKKTANGKAKRLYDRAMQYRKNRLYDKAMKDLQGAINANSQFIDAYLQLANLQIGEEHWQKAGKNLEKVIALDATYEPRVYYLLGVAYWEQDQFEQAADRLQTFLEVYNSDNGSLKEKAIVYLRNSQFATTAIKNPVPFDPKPLATTINTTHPEYLPSITAEGDKLIFTRRTSGQEDVYESNLVEGEWQTASMMPNINTEYDNEGSQYISADGQLIVFVKCSDRTGYGGCDLYFSEKKEGNWTKPKNMGQPINTKSWESQPSLSADGNLLYFASNRAGGKGGRDIWLTYRKASGNWAKPVNLGPTINTPYDDESPFYHPDGNSLYFMSTGHPGMGGYDLFISRRGRAGVWETIQNLGYPINTKGNEGALFITLDGKTAYFARDGLKLNEAIKNPLFSKKQPDIFTFELPEAVRATPVTYVKAMVKDGNTKELLKEATIELIELSSGMVISSSQTDEQGSFLTCLPLGNDYALNVNKTTYLFHSENFSLSKIASLSQPYQLNIELYPIPATTISLPEKTKPIILKNVFFESGSAELKSTSIAELTKLKELLEENPTLNIQLSGHTDNVGSDTDNLLLSEQRAKAVQDYLIREGIVTSRLRYKGYGEGQPIDTNDTEDGRKNNRRTEFVIQ